MKTDTGDKQQVPSLGDAQVASLEDYLPGGEAAGSDGGKSLQTRIVAALAQLDQRLSGQSREMIPASDFRQLVAARQAVQAARLAMQLHHAGQQDGKR